MRFTRIATAGVVVAAGALVLSGCTQPYESEVVEGTEITIAYNESFFHFNDDSGAGNNTANGNVKYMVDTMFYYYDDEPKVVRNTDFGTYEKTSDDPLTVEYEINEGVVWSDGVPVSGADLLLQWAAMSGNVESDVAFAPATTSGLSLVTEIPEISDRGITLVYDEPFVDWELAFDVGVSAHGTYALAFPEEYADVQSAWDAYSASGEEDDFKSYSDAAKAFAEDATDAVVTAIQDGDTATIGALAKAWNEDYAYTTMPDNPAKFLSNGPYVIDEIAEDDYITLAANPLFTWGPSPHFEKITIRTIADSTAALQALQNGELDVWTGQPTADTLEIAKGIDGAQIEQRQEASYEHLDLTFNNGGPFDPATYGGDKDKAQKVREAFLLTVPRQEIVDKIIKPLDPEAEVRNSQMIIPGVEGYDKMVEENGSATYAEVDIEKAKSLLAEAGVTTPIDVKFWYPEGNVRRGQEFELIAASAALAGFNVIDDSEPNWEFTDPSIHAINPHDVAIFAWQSESLAISGSDQIFGTYTDPLLKGGNYNGYSNPAVDEGLKELETLTEPEDQLAAQIKIEQALWGDAYGLTIFQFPGLLVWSANVEGVSAMPLSPTYLWNFWEWTPTKAGE
ncbi:ABC transporter family substrate-binding protein [Ruicaihuangia caeni]|uniref:ABC transporter family substrate-binding protein n=1 Tax=Ruicaihuangia caeni TaxID=3042517 RepID=A0AAW6TE03_9MICO|nr:ABC transporter family substrate-binding protein [Klugiella sp. YN-L-19]MDI2099645.1 ABC transporter family substrate-binding protein [Klugiella sp. YN-L-19]